MESSNPLLATVRATVLSLGAGAVFAYPGAHLTKDAKVTMAQTRHGLREVGIDAVTGRVLENGRESTRAEADEARSEHEGGGARPSTNTSTGTPPTNGRVSKTEPVTMELSIFSEI